MIDNGSIHSLCMIHTSILQPENICRKNYIYLQTISWLPYAISYLQFMGLRSLQVNCGP